MRVGSRTVGPSLEGSKRVKQAKGGRAGGGGAASRRGALLRQDRARVPGTQNQHGDHMSEPRAAPVAAPASMPMASGAPEL